ncbi:MAG: cell division protein FtsA [Bdellovibrionales bacterium]|nr:cell division protein FtsA [Bdellovibrionales bacterium]
MAKQEFIVGLDIGTTKICAIVGQLTENGIDIVGIGTRPSTGLRKGAVINIDSTVEGIQRAIEEAELMAGCEIDRAYVGVAGNHVRSFNSSGVVSVKNHEINSDDIERVIDAAKAIAIPADRQVIHLIPQDFIIDGQDGIKDPVGMSGVRLEGKIHIVTGSSSSTQNLVKCANRAGLGVAELVLEPIASAEAVLSEDEKELGVALVDIGGGTSDICIFVGGALVHTGVINVGGNHITNDIAVGLRTPQTEGEKLKIRHGCALKDLIAPEETIEVPGVGGRQPRIVARRLLAEIIEPRVEEMFQLIKAEIEKTGYTELVGSGVVLTGGASMLEGMPELAEMVFDMPVKRGYPAGMGGLRDIVNSPKFATGVGLLKFAAKKIQQQQHRSAQSEGRAARRVREVMGGWIRDLF